MLAVGDVVAVIVGGIPTLVEVVDSRSPERVLGLSLEDDLFLDMTWANFYDYVGRVD